MAAGDGALLSPESAIAILWKMQSIESKRKYQRLTDRAPALCGATAQAPRAIALVAALAGMLGVSAGCGLSGDRHDGPVSVEQITTRGTLRVATRNAPTSYLIDHRGQPSGPEYDLLAGFAESLDVELEIVVKPTVSGVIDTLRKGRVDLAAASLVATPSRSQEFAATQPYRTITQQVVCARAGARPDNAGELVGIRLAVPKDTSYVDTLSAFAASHPGLNFDQRAKTSTEALLREVSEQKLDCTVADSHIIAINQRYLPELVVRMDATEQQSLVWLMAGEDDDDTDGNAAADSLLAAANAWLASGNGQQALAQVERRYYAKAVEFDYVDTRAFVRRIEERLPSYADLFSGAADNHSIDPILLAAQGYQESHWDAEARSPTGVRGIMMLTRNTAESLGVEDRLDPAQSIEGGARYLAQMRDKFDSSIAEPDRTYLALAAYNVGYAHLRDAQRLAERLGKNSVSWADMRTVLPLLSKAEYHTTLRYGYARGHEPVRYVARIQNYEDILSNIGAELLVDD